MTDKQEITREILQNWADNMEDKMITHYINRLESVLREQIALEIESMCCDVVHNESNPQDCERMNFWYRHAASIARGKND